MLLATLGMLALSHSAEAASCSAKAAQVAAASSARVLTVQSVVQGGVNMCKITMLITPKSGPARRRTVTVQK